MNRAGRTRCVLLAVAVSAAGAVSTALGTVPADAAPAAHASPAAHAAPAAPTGPTRPAAHGTTQELRHVVAASRDVVMIVHVASTGQLREAVAGALGSGHHTAAVAGTRLRHSFPGQRAFSVQVPTDDQQRTAARLRALPGVTAVETPVLRRFTATPDDPHYTTQQPYLAAVAAPAAWAREHGSPAVRIAVVDSGLDIGHPDLGPKIVGTYDAHTGGSVVTDLVGHGTFVAGVAAAATDNGIGIAGVGYDSSILGVKIASPDGSIALDDEVAGIRWATDHGADVINLSIGGLDPSDAERSAVEYAIAHGVVVVAAAGNDADSLQEYPAAYPGVIAVGATDTQAKTAAGFSSYGPWVTVSAPGVGILSTTPRAGSQFFPSRTGYSTGDGTSFSTPIVAGEVGLLEAKHPGLSVAALRHAVVVSAHGYQGVGLGAGQVDLARALGHLPPVTAPGGVSTTGTRDVIALHAASTAPEVAFRVDSGPWLAPARVHGGSASATWQSWGLGNGAHTLHAVDCSGYGECNTAITASRFTVRNVAPTVTFPAPSAAVTGLLTVRAQHPGGGALRLLIDGRPVALDTAAPYSFDYSASALVDGTHRLGVQLCSLDGRHCAGPRTAETTISSAALHASPVALAPVHISPDHNGVQDASAFSFTLPQWQNVVVRTLDTDGRVVRTVHLGNLHAGRHVWTWRGVRDDGSTLADGTYQVVLATSRSVGGAIRRGWISRTGVVDTRAPRLSATTGNGVGFYPYPDRYRDVFSPATTLGDTGRLTLTIRDAKNRVVRSSSATRAPGRTHLTWTGRDARARRVAAGTYRWSYAVTDAAGNTSRTRWYTVRVSERRLVPMTAYVTHNGRTYSDAGGTNAACTSASRSASTYPHGVQLVDSCAASSYDLAYARYTFTLPGAVSYRQLAIQVYGRSTHRPSELTASIARTDGGLEIPSYVKVTRAGDRWVTLVSVPAEQRVTTHHRVYITVILDSSYRGPNDFDLGQARVRVSYLGLR